MMLDELLKKAVADFAAMSKDEQDAMFKSQITSLMKTEMVRSRSVNQNER